MNKVSISQIIDCIEEALPLSLQENWDNCGLQVGDASRSTTGAIIALDATMQSLDETIACGYNLLITHHPLIFSPLHAICNTHTVERIVTKAIENKIAIYAAHTNMDNAPQGVNDRLAKQFALKNTIPLDPNPYNPLAGGGRVGDLSQPISIAAFIDRCKEVFGITHLSTNNTSLQTIKRVAICGGSGASLIAAAQKAKADVYVTGDIKYHDFLTANDTLFLVDCTHYATEQCTKEIFCDIIRKKIPTFAIRISESEKIPIQYWL